MGFYGSLSKTRNVSTTKEHNFGIMYVPLGGFEPPSPPYERGARTNSATATYDRFGRGVRLELTYGINPQNHNLLHNHSANHAILLKFHFSSFNPSFRFILSIIRHLYITHILSIKKLHGLLESN